MFLGGVGVPLVLKHVQGAHEVRAGFPRVDDVIDIPSRRGDIGFINDRFIRTGSAQMSSLPDPECNLPLRPNVRFGSCVDGCALER